MLTCNMFSSLTVQLDACLQFTSRPVTLVVIFELRRTTLHSLSLSLSLPNYEHLFLHAHLVSETKSE